MFWKFSLYYWLFLLLIFYPVLYLIYQRKKNGNSCNETVEYEGDILVKRSDDINDN